MVGEENQLESWQEYRRLVLAELERLNKAIQALDEKLDRRDLEHAEKLAKVNIDILTLKIKASIYGAIAGAIFSAIVALGSTILYKVPFHETEQQHIEQPILPKR